jgi:dihydrofolate synthase/folylpolyglutamate synthase
MQFTHFDDIVSHMETFTNLEKQTIHYTTRTYRLDRMHAILDYIGHPERDYKKIHIAGSKGKGSTASFIASGLQALGYKTGLYLSPHLVDYRERFTLGGTFFDDETLVKAGNELFSRLEGFTFSDEWGETTPTTFELYTAYAYLLFSLTNCQWAVIETGLGGRLDATNTITPEASVLCPIELEHTKILGNTIAAIAFEKSKIIKKGVPAFVGFETKEAYDVFKREATEQNSPIRFLSQELESYSYRTTKEGEMVSYTWKDGSSENLSLTMLGQVQAQNCALALLVLKTLGLTNEHTFSALEQNSLPGRFQKIGTDPDVFLDGAHTIHSLQGLLESFSLLYKGKSNTIIYGALEDKDHRGMCSLVLEYFDHIIVSKPGSYKKSDISQIAEMFKSLAKDKHQTIDLSLVEDNEKALSLALDSTLGEGAILVCGSFYLAGGIKIAYDRLRRDNVPKLA